MDLNVKYPPIYASLVWMTDGNMLVHQDRILNVLYALVLLMMKPSRVKLNLMRVFEKINFLIKQSINQNIMHLQLELFSYESFCML